MKKIILFNLLLFVFSGVASAQTADEIIDNYLKTIGGKEKLSQIKALYYKAVARVQGFEIPIEIYLTADGKQYITTELQGKKMVQLAFDGKTAWHTNFMNMQNEKFDNETTENLKRNSKDEFPNPFLNYKDKGFKVELIGKEEVEGTETFKIKLTEHQVVKDGKEVSKEIYYYFDVENYIPVVSEEEIDEGKSIGAFEQEVFNDYQDVQGIYFPFNTMIKFKGIIEQEIRIKSIVINPEINPEMFILKEEESENIK